MNSPEKIKLITSSKRSNILRKINEIYLEATSEYNDGWVREHYEKQLEDIYNHITTLIANKDCSNIKSQLNTKKLPSRELI